MARRRKRKIRPQIKLLLVIILFFVMRACIRSMDQPWSGTQEPVDTCPYAYERFTNTDGILRYEDDTYTSEYGIDVSYAQGAIDWETVKNTGVQFAMIRVGYRGYETGLLHEDDQFRNNMLGAYRAGIRTGAYFYTSAISVEEAVEEAQFVIERLNGYSMEGPVALDMEQVGPTDRDLYLGKEERTIIAAAFLKTIRNAGYIPVVYASTSWYDTEINMDALSGLASFWVADYSDKWVPLNGRFTMWQYSSEGWVDGITGPVDQNILMIKK